MTIETDIITTLDGNASLLAAIGTRNYWLNLPQEPTYPNTVTNRIDTTYSNTLTTRNGLTQGLFRAEVRAEGHAAARSTANLVIAAMEASTLFTAIVVADNDVPFEDIVKTYRIAVDFSVWFTS